MIEHLVSPELRRWLLAQVDCGREAREIVDSMRDAGWDAALAQQALQQVLEPGQAQRARAPGAPGAPDAPHGECGAMPGPALEGSPSTLVVEGHALQVLASLQRPRLVLFGGLLTSDECDALVEQARERLARSETVDLGSGDSRIDGARTSEGMFFARGQTPLVERIERRIAALLRWPVERGEGLQVLRYVAGAEYRPHHDYFDPAHAGSAAVLARGGQRVATLVMYLAAPAGGGATSFPDAGLSIAPVKGNAVFFSYEEPKPWTRSLHGGAPVLAGEKWVATKWLRQRRFD